MRHSKLITTSILPLIQSLTLKISGLLHKIVPLFTILQDREVPFQLK